MDKKVTFNQLIEDNFEQLDLYSTAITRAHGHSHPEAFEVRELYETISSEVKKSATEKPNLDVEFEQLRKITDNYKVPNDVCETYEAVYDMLAEADKVYQDK